MFSNVSMYVELAIIALLLGGIGRFRKPTGARIGNHAAGFSLLAAMAVVLSVNGTKDPVIIGIAITLGLIVSIVAAYRIDMKNMPSMIAVQNGMGGLASCLISFVELHGASGNGGGIGRFAGFIGVSLGAATLSGSVVAALKLSNRLKRAGLARFNNVGLVGSLLLLVGIAVYGWTSGAGSVAYVAGGMIVTALCLGYLFAVRIGGADMPVLISFLNSASGLAAAFCGVVVNSRLLVVCGATVASSGFILTHVMCRAMNRGLKNIFFGTAGAVSSATAVASEPEAVEMQKLNTDSGLSLEERVDQVARAAVDAETVIIVPGYGMALAQAQFALVELAGRLEKLGKKVLFAIHPVAGRMPGHMNVLLAEADVDYEKLCEMDVVNAEFSRADLVLVVGACDVVNPAAIHKEGTPLSGMPILMAHEAEKIAICNLDSRPGYSGVENPLYSDPKTTLLFGDAKATLEMLNDAVQAGAGRECNIA